MGCLGLTLLHGRKDLRGSKYLGIIYNFFSSSFFNKYVPGNVIETIEELLFLHILLEKQASIREGSYSNICGRKEKVVKMSRAPKRTERNGEN